MNLFRLFLAFVFFLLSFSPEVFARQNPSPPVADVAGVVLDESGAAVPQVDVVLTNQGTSEKRTTKTDESGKFFFQGVPLGAYTLKAAAGSRAATLSNVRITADSENRVTLRLSSPVGLLGGLFGHPPRDGSGATGTGARPPVAEADGAPPPPPPPPPVLVHPPVRLPVAAAPPRTEALAAEGNYYTMKVFYATDRRATGQTVPANFYGGAPDPSETLSLGTCEVSIPRDHRPGELEAPSIWKLEFHEDPSKHVVLMNVQPEPQTNFYSDVAAAVAASDKKDAFIFIHGYKTTFEDAARRTGQLAYDLNFHGAAIFYSWPSRGDLDGYSADEESVIWTAKHLTAFLQQVSMQSHATTVHLIAHSMGNRALTQALANLADSPTEATRPHFREVILAAPDVNTDIFRQLAPAMEQSADRVTLYASSHDEALAASKNIHEYPRAGEAGQNLVVVNGVDTIDVSAIDTSLLGHSYFGDNASVIADIQRLFSMGLPPGQRACLSQSSLLNLAYWVFVRNTCPAS